MNNMKLERMYDHIRQIVKKHDFKVVLAKGGPGSTVPRDPNSPYVIDYIGQMVPQEHRPLKNPDQLIGWEEFQKHPEIKEIMPDMWHEFEMDARYDEEFRLSY